MAETFSGLFGNVLGWQGTIVSLLTYAFAIIYVRDGQTISTLKIQDGDTLYSPEQDVLWSHVGTWGTTTNTEGHVTRDILIKTMRKMKEGDKIVFLALGSVANALRHLGGQFTSFYKQ